MKIVLTRIASSFLFISILGILGFLTASNLSNKYSLSPSEITHFRVISLAIFAWAVLSKVGWGIQTWSGKTLPEQIDKYWFYVLYIIGFYLGITSIYLQPK